MDVILTQTIDSLGIIGTEVTVADGYARNYLLPQNKAILATDANRRKLEQEKAKFEVQIAKEKAMAEEMAKRLKGVTCTITGRISDEDRLYGSIKVRDVVNALEKEGVKVEKRMVLLSDPIKNLGTYKIPVRVYTDVEPEITLEVVAEARED